MDSELVFSKCLILPKSYYGRPGPFRFTVVVWDKGDSREIPDRFCENVLRLTVALENKKTVCVCVFFFFPFPFL